MTAYTIGYQKRSVAELVSVLKENGVSMLVDTRHRAQSRVKGMSKTALSEALAEAGIEYHHDRRLGTPEEIRQGPGCMAPYKAEDYFSWLARNNEVIEDLAKVVKDKSFALMCYERDVEECHRQHLTQHLEAVKGMAFKHL
jgi:uncharacterized protein (DUF488 family)